MVAQGLKYLTFHVKLFVHFNKKIFFPSNRQGSDISCSITHEKISTQTLSRRASAVWLVPSLFIWSLRLAPPAEMISTGSGQLVPQAGCGGRSGGGHNYAPGSREGRKKDGAVGGRVPFVAWRACVLHYRRYIATSRKDAGKWRSGVVVSESRAPQPFQVFQQEGSEFLAVIFQKIISSDFLKQRHRSTPVVHAQLSWISDKCLEF